MDQGPNGSEVLSRVFFWLWCFSALVVDALHTRIESTVIKGGDDKTRGVANILSEWDLYKSRNWARHRRHRKGAAHWEAMPNARMQHGGNSPGTRCWKERGLQWIASSTCIKARALLHYSEHSHRRHRSEVMLPLRLFIGWNTVARSQHHI